MKLTMRVIIAVAFAALMLAGRQPRLAGWVHAQSSAIADYPAVTAPPD